MKNKFIKAACLGVCALIALVSLPACNCSDDVDPIKAGASSGYEKSGQNESFKYDVFKDHVVITGYVGEEANIEIPESIDDKTVTTIAVNTFYGCADTVKTVKIPKSITLIEENAFTGNKIESIEIDSENKSYVVENGILMDKDKTVLLAYAAGSAAEEVTIPDTITAIPSGVFSKCSNIKTVNIPSSVKNIATFAFMGSGITTMKLPEGVEEIGQGVFWQCKNLETLELPESLTNICNPETICQGCTSLKTVKGYDSTDAKMIVDGEDVNAEYVSLG